MNREQKLEELLERLVKDLNTYNQHDMLGGYLDDLGSAYNGDLADLDLTTLEQVGGDED